MPTYHVQSGELQLTTTANNARGAALWAVHRAMSHTLPFLDVGSEPDDLSAFPTKLDDAVLVSEDRRVVSEDGPHDESIRYETFELVVEWSQLLAALSKLEADLDVPATCRPAF